MSHIAGAPEFLKAHGYRLERTGPIEWTVYDEETESGEPETVAQGTTPAEACRAAIAARFSA
jgi:hypothetical protein